MKKHVLIVGNFIYPCGNASGKRVKGIEDILNNLGYETHVLSLPNKYSDQKRESNQDTVHFYNTKNETMRWLCFYRYKNSVIQEIKNIGISNIAFLYIYSCPTLAIAETLIISFCKKNKIITVTDCVDWIENSYGRFHISNLLKFVNCNYEKRIANCQADGTVVVSRYLEKYYKSKQQPVCIIPPVSQSVKRNYKKRDSLFLLYAGQPFSIKKDLNVSKYKDRLDVIIEMVIFLNNNSIKTELNIFGITKEEYCTVVKKHRNKKYYEHSYLHFHGLVNNEEVIKEIQKSDYVILFRDLNKVSKAGFPTKVSEANNCGVPVISNNTGDIGIYLSRNDNNIILPDNPAEAKEFLLNKLRDRQNTIKEYVIEDSEFETEKFTDKLSNFLERIGITRN